MFDIKVLRQKKTDLLAKVTAIQALTKTENRDLTEAERTEYDGAMASIKTVNGDIVRVEALMEEERNNPAPAAAGTGARAGKPNASKKPWNNLGEQLFAIKEASTTHGRKVDDRLYAALGANESVDSEGGFLVDPEYSGDILQRSYETGIVSKRCFDLTINKSRMIMHAVDESSRADGSRFGGIQSYWAAEGTSYTPTKPKFREIQIVMNKLIGLMYGTEEQMEDAPSLGSYASKVFPMEFGFRIDDALFNGAGAGQPLGIMNAGCLITVAKDAGDTGATVSTNDVLNMWKRRWGPSSSNYVWFINQDIEQSLYTMTLGSGTAVQLLYTPPGVNGSQYGKLLGRDVIPVEQAATLGTPGDIVLADMSQYLLGKKGDIRADSSLHVAFLTGEMAFRWMLRLDGQPWWNKPLTPKNGSNTQSPFIALATRS